MRTKSKLTDEQRQEKIDNTIIKKEHFRSERIYQKFHKNVLKLGYNDINEFVKQEYFSKNKTQKEVTEMVNCKHWDLSSALCKAGLNGLKKYKKNGCSRKYTKPKSGYKKSGKQYKNITPNTNPQTEKWYKCTNCGEKTRNRLLCDYCYVNADKEMEYDEHKVYVD